MSDIGSGFCIKSEMGVDKIRRAGECSHNRNELIIIIISFQVVNLIVAVEKTSSN